MHNFPKQQVGYAKPLLQLRIKFTKRDRRRANLCKIVWVPYRMALYHSFINAPESLNRLFSKQRSDLLHCLTAGICSFSSSFVDFFFRFSLYFSQIHLSNHSHFEAKVLVRTRARPKRVCLITATKLGGKPVDTCCADGNIIN